MFEYSEEYLEELLKGIFEGRINSNNLPEDLYNATAKHLHQGVVKGFGKNLNTIQFGGPDYNMLSQLKTNVYMFSAAKTFQQTMQMSQALITPDGDLRSFEDFKKEARGIFETFNNRYLRAEYDTAITQGGNAAKWMDIEDKKHLLPYLRYIAVHDQRVCEICSPLNDVTLPIEDPFWKTHSPANHFYCRCVLEQLEKSEGEQSKSTPTQVEEAKKQSKVPDEFKYNAGLQQEIFSTEGASKHPYFSVPKKYVQFAQHNFGLPLPGESDGNALVFQAAKTIKEAEAFARNVMKMEHVDYSKFDPKVANALNKVIHNTKQVFPELSFKGLGNSQATNRAIKSQVREQYLNSDKYKSLVLSYGQKTADRVVKRFVNRFVENVGKDNIAWSTNYKLYKSEIGEIDLRKFKGIFFNEKKAASAAGIEATIEHARLDGWSVQGAKGVEYVVNHELGHEMDDLLLIRDNPTFMQVFAREHKAGSRVLESRLSRYGATAGGKIRNLREEMIAESWAEYVGSTNPRELSTQIGDLIVKEYFDKFVKVNPGVNFPDWKAQVLKQLRS
jgi:SPP1 gp7 family putative phage head morphogenesis protein